MTRTALRPQILFAASGFAGATFGPPPGATLQGRQVHGLWEVFFAAALGVAAIVYGLIFWSILRYRKRSGELPPQFREHVPLEIAYTIIPLLIVAVLFVLTYRTETFVDRVSTAADPPVTIRVTAFQWSWRFQYDGTPVQVAGTPDRPPEAVVPTGEAIRFILDSADVMHAFWVPAFLFKRDAMPGLTNQVDLTVQQPGTYLGECAEFCGLDHARMLFTIKAISPADYQRWLRRSRGSL
jgi:cytochrome c oxidase subunit II